mmetsp:Transcript_13161/g.15063  ORF Transcript_13161/g.15063 Transcript_13161/m.15063 type:complete len:608 (+) Transcript_13161:219-2042(+)|eukprot:CAMPEP_0194131994 /NCGR_PEP_ID=MMETSP0152-20130528/2579_1 /TAXON_ID=1049557 /ORGANISM="Thalassiothrix antarctica, Strain L6-D1" /LENGTH=607 /DNA_ID=CAMNT_0038826901 /DNA_START=150 /DNA_END=1973 /DNA_ORIENTATION=-
MDTFTKIVETATNSTDIAFEIPNIPAVYANFIMHSIFTILREFVVAMVVYAYFVEKMMLFTMKASKNWHSLSTPAEANHKFWPRLLRVNWPLGIWALLFALICFSWDALMDLGLVFEPVPIAGGNTISCLVWSNEGPESVGDVLPTMGKIFRYESNATEGNTSVGAVQDKELLRRSIAEGSFGLLNLPILTGGVAIGSPGGFSPRDYYYGKEGLLTFYKSTGVSRDYDPNRREGGRVEYGGHNIYSPTSKTFGGEEKVAIIHGIGSTRVQHKNKGNDCINKLQQMAGDAQAQGTDAIKWDSYKKSENCTGTLLVRSQDLSECVSFYKLGNYSFVFEKLIGAVKIFSNHSGNIIDGKTICENSGFRFEPESRVVLVQTDKTKDHTMMDPYIRALVRDGYASKQEPIRFPEGLSDRDALRLVRMLADIMSDEYRFRPDFCRDIKLKVYLGFRWFWVIMLASIIIFMIISTGIAYCVSAGTTVKLFQLQENTVWFEAGTEKGAEGFVFDIDPTAGEDKRGCKGIKRWLDEWCHAFQCATDNPSENDSQFEFKLEGGNKVTVRNSRNNTKSARKSCIHPSDTEIELLKMPEPMCQTEAWLTSHKVKRRSSI